MIDSLNLPLPADPLGTFDAIAAWLLLTPVQRDMIGVYALRFAFGVLVSEDVFDKADRVLGRDINEAGRDEESLAMTGLLQSVEAALPAVFGVGGEDPEWILADPRTDAETADAAINGLRRVFVPASMLEVRP